MRESGRAHRRLRRRRAGQSKPRPDPRRAARRPGRRPGRAAVLRPHRPRPPTTPAAGRRDRSTSAAGTSATSAGDPVVIDWRAPIARAFYRATADDRMGVQLRRRFGFHARPADLLRGRAPGPRRGARAGLGPAARRDRAAPRRADARHRRDHPARPGRARPRRPGHVAVHPGRARHRQDRGRAAPRRLPALHLPRPAAALRRAGGRPERRVPALHRAGAAVARRGRHRAEPPSTSWSALAAARHASRPPLADAQGRRADGRRAAPRGAARHVAKPTEDVVAIVGTRRYRVGAHHLRRYVDDARRALGDGLRWSIARERLRTQVAEDVRRQREDAGGAPTRRRDRAGRPLAGGARVRRRGVAGAAPRRRCSPGSTTTRSSCAAASAALLDDDERGAAAPAPRRGRCAAVALDPADAVLLDELDRR